MLRFGLAVVAVVACFPAIAQTATGTGVGIGISSSSSQSSATAFGGGQGGQGGQGGTGGNAQSGLTINNQAQPSVITTRTDGTQIIEQRGGTVNRTRTSGTQRLIAAPSTFGPGLAAAGIESCLGSVSVGGSFPGGGFSFGSTTKDNGCDARLDARQLWAMGLKRAAVFRLCQKEEIRASMPEVCPQPATETVYGYRTVAAVGPAGPEPMAAIGLPDGPVEVIEQRTGRTRLCAVYNADRHRCLRWGR